MDLMALETFAEVVKMGFHMQSLGESGCGLSTRFSIGLRARVTACRMLCGVLALVALTPPLRAAAVSDNNIESDSFLKVRLNLRVRLLYRLRRKLNRLIYLSRNLRWILIIVILCLIILLLLGVQPNQNHLIQIVQYLITL